MRKFITLAAVALLISTMTYGANGIAPTFEGSITIAATAGTNTTSEFLVGNDDLSIGARAIESFSVYNASGTNEAAGYLIMVDGGFDTTIGTSASVAAGIGSIVYPVRTIVTATNGSEVAYAPYFARKVKVQVIQDVTLGPGTYNWFIKTK